MEKWFRLVSNHNPSLPAMTVMFSFSSLIVKAKQTNDLRQIGIKGHEGIIRKNSLVINSMFHSERTKHVA